MKRKSCNTLIVALCMLMGMALLLGACGSEAPAAPTADATVVADDPDPSPADDLTPAPTVAAMTDGYYLYQGERTADLPCFIRFNEDGTFYGSYFNGAVVEAGIYEVVDRDMAYLEDGEGSASLIAGQVVVLTDFSTGAVQEVAFDGGRLLDMTVGNMAPHITLEHIPDFAYNPAEMELPIAVQTFYHDNDFGASLTLYHDGSFNDFTTSGEFGSWTMENGQFILVSFDGTSYTLTVAADGFTAVYDRGADILELTASVGEYLFSFTVDTMPEGLPMDVSLTLYAKTDGTAEMVMSSGFFDDIVVDQGTFTLEHMVFITFDLENGGIIAGEPDFDNATEAGVPATIHYEAEVLLPGNGADMPDMTLGFDCLLVGEITG